MKPGGKIRVCVGATTASVALLAFALPAGALASSAPGEAAGVQPEAEYAAHAAVQEVSNLRASVPSVPTGPPAAPVPLVAPQPPPAVNVVSDVAATPQAVAVGTSAARTIPDGAPAPRAVAESSPATPVVSAPDPSAGAIPPPHSPAGTGSASSAAAVHAETAAANESPSAPDPSPVRQREVSRTTRSSVPAVSPVPSPATANLGAPIAVSEVMTAGSALAKSMNLRVRQMLADIENGLRAAPSPGEQPSAVSRLASQLDSLLTTIGGSAGDEPRVSAFSVSPRGPDRSEPALGSGSRAAAAERSFVANDAAFLRGPPRAAGVVRRPPGPPPLAGASPAGLPISAAAILPQTSIQAAQVVRARHRSGNAHRSQQPSASIVETPDTVVGAPLPSASLPAGAAPGGGGGGIGVGLSALLIVAALWLLQAVLPGRLTLDLLPWQSTLLALRLERPG